MRKSTKSKIDWQEASDIKERVRFLINLTELDFNPDQIFTFRSVSAKTNAYARIWGLSRIWQLALGLGPSYILEVISEKFDRLSQEQKDKILLHEIAHIPKNFSGALAPHKHGKGHFHDKLKKLIALYDRKIE